MGMQKSEAAAKSLRHVEWKPCRMAEFQTKYVAELASLDLFAGPIERLEWRDSPRLGAEKD